MIQYRIEQFIDGDTRYTKCTVSQNTIAVINHVHSYFDAKKAGYHFTAQQMLLAPQLRW